MLKGMQQRSLLQDPFMASTSHIAYANKAFIVQQDLVTADPRVSLTSRVVN